MADSGGHWSNLAELQKLSASTLVPGVVETDIKRNNPLLRIPVFKGNDTGLSIKWNEEKTTCESAVSNLPIGGQTSWSEGMTYDVRETTLTTKYIQRKLDGFVKAIYGNVNNYEAQVLVEMKKGALRKLGKSFIYDDATYPTQTPEFYGLHSWIARDGTGTVAHTAATNTTNQFATGSATGALSLKVVRNMMDAMKLGVDEIWLPFAVMQWIDAAYQEKGFAGLATALSGNISFISYGINDLGKRVAFWDGTPLVTTDYLEKELVGTGTGASADARTASTVGTTYSMLFIHRGNPLSTDNPGVAFGFGQEDNPTGALIGEGFYELTTFDKLEGYIGRGFRLVNFGTAVRSSPLSCGRIFDITDAAITV